MTNTKFPNEKLLVDVNWVEKHQKELVILDARADGYADGHIPGAISFNPSHIIDKQHSVPGFIVNEEAFTAIVQKVGIHQDSIIVVYDNGQILNAARIFYALEYYGLYDQVSILKGGYDAWLEAGLTVTTEVPEVKVGNFVAKANDSLVSSLEDVTNNIGSAEYVFFDVRSADEYNGIDLKINKNGGHIPGAVHLEWTNTITKDEKGITQLLDSECLHQLFEQLGVVKDKTIVPYCQTNVRGSNAYFELRLLGYEDIRPYEGSWAEWGNTEGVNIEVPAT